MSHNNYYVNSNLTSIIVRAYSRIHTILVEIKKGVAGLVGVGEGIGEEIVGVVISEIFAFAPGYPYRATHAPKDKTLLNFPQFHFFYPGASEEIMPIDKCCFKMIQLEIKDA